MSEIQLQVGVKIFLKNKEGKFLLLKRNQSKYVEIKNPWDIPGGRINKGEKLIDNLRREVREETQLEIKDVPKLIFAQDIIFGEEKHVVRLSYLGSTEGEPILDTKENTEYNWLNLEELKVQEGLDSYAKEAISEISTPFDNTGGVVK